MTMSARDQKLFGFWAVGMVALGVYWFLLRDTAVAVVPTTATTESVEMAEQRLARLRDIAATAPGKEEVLKKVSAELATREQGLIRAATVQQAQAQILSILGELLVLEAPPIEIRSKEMSAVEPFGDGYGLAPVRVQFECRVAQLVNVLAGLAARTELTATRNIQIQASNPREKTIRVTLTVVGVVPKELVPDKSKKGVAGL
jgi:hypothetical protein